MKLKDAIHSLGAKSSINIAKEIALQKGIDWDGGVKFVFSAIAHDPERAPGNIGGRNDSEEDVIRKWLRKYQDGYDKRASIRISNLPGTISDPIIRTIISSRLKLNDKDSLDRVIYAHRLCMSAENILGLILEEYLSENLIESGWYCAWGETVKSVDFVHKDGERLLQIKNRSNSENSSSKTVRDGTRIEHWFRIEASSGKFCWSKLNQICKTTCLSEENFIEFVQRTLKKNPWCLAIEKKNPWENKAN